MTCRAMGHEPLLRPDYKDLEQTTRKEPRSGRAGRVFQHLGHLNLNDGLMTLLFPFLSSGPRNPGRFFFFLPL